MNGALFGVVFLLSSRIRGQGLEAPDIDLVVSHFSFCLLMDPFHCRVNADNHDELE